MRKANAIVMNYNEFEELVSKVSNGHVGVEFEGNEWFYTVDDECDCKDIDTDLSKHLGVTVIAVRIDFTPDEDDVIIIYE